MTKTEELSILDEYSIASYSNLTIEEAKAMLILTGNAKECNGIIYVDTTVIPLETFDESLLREAQAYIKRSRVLDFIDDNQGCSRYNIKVYLESIGFNPSYMGVELILTILTEEGAGIYEDDEDRIYSI